SKMLGEAAEGKERNSVGKAYAYNTKSNKVNSSRADGRVGANSKNGDRRRPSLDVIGAITLAVTIASFLLILTYIGNTSSSNSSSVYSTQIVVLSLALLSIGSLTSFVLIERRASSPLIERSLMTHKILLPANIIILIFGMSKFMADQTIPILVRSP